MDSDEAKIYSAILVAASVLALILIFFIISLLRQRKKIDQLHKDKINAEITTLENERKRVAADLHDAVAMTLSVAKLQLSSINALSSDDQQLVSKACDHIDNSLTKIREIISNLSPTALARKGLVSALQELFHSINDAHSLLIEYSLPENRVDIPSATGVHLFRIIQEIIHNAIKHSGASTLTFFFDVESNCLKFLISDNGIGFDEKKVVQQNTGLGLRNIMSRMELLNGTLYLETKKGKGVSYQIDVPTIM